MTWVIVVGVLAALVWGYSCYRLGLLSEWHHFHIGLVLFVYGLIAGLFWVAIVGTALMVDDALQHAVQIWKRGFRSPLHLLYRHTLYAWAHQQ